MGVGSGSAYDDKPSKTWVGFGSCSKDVVKKEEEDEPRTISDDIEFV